MVKILRRQKISGNVMVGTVPTFFTRQIKLFGKQTQVDHRDERGVALTEVEAEANGDSKSTNERGPTLVECLSCRYKRFLSYLDYFSHPSTKYFFPHHTLF